MAPKKLSLVLLLLGKAHMQVQRLDAALRAIEAIEKNVDIVIAADSLQWSTSPRMQMLEVRKPEYKIIYDEENGGLPARTMNLGLSQATGEYVFFAKLSDPIADRVRVYLEQITILFKKKKNQQDEYDKGKAIFLLPQVQPPAVGPLEGNEYGWLMCEAVDAGAFCVPRSVLTQIGHIDENPLLYLEIERWYALAVSGNSSLIRVAADEKLSASKLSSSGEARFLPHHAPPSDLAIRYAQYANGINAKKAPPEEIAQRFAKDLSAEDARIYEQLTGIRRCESETGRKILLVGGWWEYHHEQICFLNYLEKLQGSGLGTYRTCYENGLPFERMLDYDLVIFVRCRSESAIRSMKICRALHIRTVYMIDDNWLSIAKDYPALYGKLFVPGNPNYELFLDALTLCDVTWLFNETLEKDMLPYTNKTVRFQISVERDGFKTEHIRERTNDKIYVGFSGSLRYSDEAFRALAAYARRHKNIQLVFMGILSEAQRSLFRNMTVIEFGFMSYKQYAKHIARIAPDLLIAPLDDNHTNQSKCYNKYIESAVVGAACIFNNVEPYNAVVRDGENGFLLDGHTAEDWYQKLEEVLSNLPLLRNVQKAAYDDIIRHHTTDQLLPGFEGVMKDLLKGSGKDA